MLFKTVGRAMMKVVNSSLKNYMPMKHVNKGIVVSEKTTTFNSTTRFKIKTHNLVTFNKQTK